MFVKRNLIFFVSAFYVAIGIPSLVMASSPTVEEVEDSDDGILHGATPIIQPWTSSSQPQEDMESSARESNKVDEFLIVIGLLNNATGFNVMDLLSFKGEMSLNMINITDSLGKDNTGGERGTLGHMLASRNDPNAARLFNRFIDLAIQNYYYIWTQNQEDGPQENSGEKVIPKTCIDAFWEEFLQKKNKHGNTICHVAAESGSRWFFWMSKRWGMPNSALMVDGPSNNTLLHSAISSGMNPEVKVMMVRYLTSLLKENNYLKTVLETKTSSGLTPSDMAGQLRLRHIVGYLNDQKVKEDSAAAATS